MRTKEDYKRIAEIIKVVKPISETEPEISSVRITANNIAIRLANYFESDPHFLRGKFLKDCGLLECSLRI